MLQGAGGCLTEEGFRVLSAATPGAAPRDLADHVAMCQRCQDRMLATARRAPEAASSPRGASLLWWGTLVALAGLVLALVALMVARMLATPPR